MITVGSDAHLPEDVGSGFIEALGLVKEAGFDRIARYEKRMCLFQPL
ncbi:MAG: PHP-associated domain-containing protein [Enterocloster sp.]